MQNIIDNLNNEFSLQLCLLNVYLHDHLNNSDKRLAIHWVEKLKSESTSIEEARLRNDFIYYLVQSVRAGCLEPPFDQKPPNGPILNLRSILAEYIKPKVKTESTASRSHPKPEIFERSPDKGVFLAAQPVPRSGAFCYFAIVSKEKK